MSSMDFGLTDKVALVTGASQGLGRATAAALAAEGARVAISSRSREPIHAPAGAIGATGFVHDSLDLDKAPRLVDEVEQVLGPVDVLVFNTGGGARRGQPAAPARPPGARGAPA